MASPAISSSSENISKFLETLQSDLKVLSSETKKKYPQIKEVRRDVKSALLYFELLKTKVLDLLKLFVWFYMIYNICTSCRMFALDLEKVKKFVLYNEYKL